MGEHLHHRSNFLNAARGASKGIEALETEEREEHIDDLISSFGSGFPIFPGNTMSTCTRIRIGASFLSCLDSGQAMVDCSSIKVLADNPVGQASEFILVIIQIVTMVKQQLCKLRQDLSQGVLVLQFHKCPRAAAVLEWPASFPCDAEGILLLGIKGQNLFQTNLMLPPVS